MEQHDKSVRKGKVLTSALAVAALVVGLPSGTISTAHAAGVTVSAWASTASGTLDLAPQPDIELGAVSHGAINVRVSDSQAYQPYQGVGASFTDSSAMLLVNLKETNPARYSVLMTRLFSATDGDAMGLWRVPMGASDFTATSTHWTNADIKGPSGNLLANFGLTDRDSDYIIPVIKDALTINPNLKIMASPWTAPAWMKSNNSVICRVNGNNGSLLPEYYQTWADYFVKWIQAYQEEGIPIWAITPQNEPQYCPDTYTGMSWTASQQVTWVNDYLYPTLQEANLDPLIFGWDHNFTSTSFAQSVVNGTSSEVVDGVAWHCYDSDADPAYMTKVRSSDPSRMIVETECSSNVLPTDIIIYSTIEMALLSFQNYAQGVILWNVALDSLGGPHLGGCVGCHPVVRVDQSSSGQWDWSLHGNLSSLSHISRFVSDGAVRIDSASNAHGIVTGAFQNSDGSEVLIATNTTSASVTFTVTWNGQGSFTYTLPSRGIATFKGMIPSDTVSGDTPQVGGVYRIQSRISEKPIGVRGGLIGNGEPLVTWSNNGDPDQRWQVTNAGQGYVNLINIKSNKAIDVPNGATTNGLLLQQWDITGTGNGNQQWQLLSIGNGWYNIVNRNTGKALDVTDGNITDGTTVQQWTRDVNNPNQQFRFIRVG